MATRIETAGFLVRLFAFLADQFLLAAVAFGCMSAAGSLLSSTGATQSSFPLVAAALGYLAALVYFRFLVVRHGATPGKRNFRLIIVREDGSPISGGQAMARMVLEPVSFALAGSGVLMVAFRGDRRALHDIATRTRVVYKQSLPG